MTVNLPRTGYCVDRDSIPLEVTIDNGSNRSVKSLTAAIERTVVYKASPGGSRPTGPFPVASTSSEPIAPHSTFVWKPDNFEVPDVEPTSIFDTAINIVYHLKVSAAIKYGRDPKISIPLSLGNVPAPGPDVPLDPFNDFGTIDFIRDITAMSPFDTPTLSACTTIITRTSTTTSTSGPHHVQQPIYITQ